MTRKTLLNDNRKSGGRSFDDNYSSNEESVRKTSSWTETNEKISNKYSESKFNDDLEGIHHEESISCESSTPPADEAMKVNILYRGMVYRIKGIKVICSVVAGIIILLAAMLLLGLWIVVGSKENGEINWPWSPEAHDMELPLNKTIEDTTVIFPFMKTVQLASIDGHTQSNVEKLEKNSKNPVLNTSEEVEEALGHFKAVHPPPKSNEHEAAKATPSDDLYVEYDYYYVIDPAVEYSVKHETLVKAPPGFTEESKVHPEPAVSQEERSKIIIAKRPELLSNDSLKSSEEGLVIEKIPPRSSPVFDNHESSNGEIKSESVVSNEFDDIDDDNEPLKRFEFKPSFEIRPASEKIESDLSRSRPVEDISIIDRSPHDHSASLKEYTEYGSFYSDDDTTITKTSLDDIAKDESNLNFESDATVGRIQEYRKPTNPVEAFFFEAQPDSQDEPDPHREVFKSRYDASQVILDDNDGRDPGYTRYFGDESHSDVFARRFGQSRSNEQQRRQIFGSELLPASSDVRVSVPGTVHPIPYVRRSHISAGVRPRIAHDDPHSFSARRGHGPLFQSRESQIHNLPHPLSVQNSRIPSNQEGIPKPTAFHILSGPVQRRYGPNTESSQSKSNGIVGTLRRMYEVASSLVPFSKSSRSGEEENTASGSRF
ncbi:uncharacterized protein LOC108672540 isoform X1 [Hyalella azteca]|uniref:Uncharacterized protein LOC108672540 isoform X1 n=1 Tax=Hyalella azteca TaxID=294128 RepID=A0A8B7NPW2_HYAAZ|nr:uncharacterized protein LOC108672540 isoform X1 [Hyalella azteca]